MFKILCLSCLFVFGATAVNAQATTMDSQTKKEAKQRGERADLSPEDRAMKQTNRMAKFLELDEEQKAKLQAINLTYAIKMEDFRKDTEAERKQMREEFKDIRKDQDASIDQILTKEQLAKLDAKKAEMKEKREARRNGEGGERRRGRGGRGQ